MSRTPFAETELLLAIMEERPEDAARIADDMLPGERRAFRRQLLEAVETVGDAGL